MRQCRDCSIEIVDKNRHRGLRCWPCYRAQRRKCYRDTHPLSERFRRPPTYWNPLREEVERLFRNGMRQYLIARYYRVSRNVIAGIIDRARVNGRIPKPYQPPPNPFPEPGGCLFIAGDPSKGAKCCGEPVMRYGAPYCEAHHAICYRPLWPVLSKALQ